MHYEDKKTGFKFDAVNGLPKENTVEAFEELFAVKKEAEEGELPEPPKPQHMRSLGYDGSQMREYARQAIAADRASRQVVAPDSLEAIAKQWDGCGYDDVGGEINIGDALRRDFSKIASRQVASNAKQGPRLLDRPTDDEKVSIGSAEFFEMLLQYGKEPSLGKRLDIAEFIDLHIDKLVANKPQAEPVAWCAPDKDGKPLFGKGWMFSVVKHLQATMPLYATPPVTTSVITVETIDTPEFRERLRGLGATLSVHSDAYMRLVGYVNRRNLVAAQVGQVAIPDVIYEAIAAAFEDRKGWRTKIAAAVRALPERESK